MYITGDLWEEMLAKEKEKVRELEERYATKLRERKVRVIGLVGFFHIAWSRDL